LIPPLTLSVRVGVAVRLTGISRSKLYELIKARQFQTVKVGSSTLILMESLRQLLHGSPAETLDREL
jgi:hypothetical protein